MLMVAYEIVKGDGAPGSNHVGLSNMKDTMYYVQN